MRSSTATFFKRCTMAAILAAATAFAAGGDAAGPAPAFSLTNLRDNPTRLSHTRARW